MTTVHAAKLLSAIVLLPTLSLARYSHPTGEDYETPVTKPFIPPLPSSITIVSQRHFAKNQFFCRIHGICRLGDGTTLLPEWMQAQAEYLTHCGLGNISFTLSNISNSSHPASPTLWKASRDGSVSLTDNLRQYDLLGGGDDGLSAERQVLASQITPLLHAVDLFNHPRAYANNISSICIQSDNKPCRYSPDPQTASTPVHAILLVDSRISNTKDFHWPKSLLRLVRSSLDARLQTKDHRAVFAWRIRTHAACFRSIITTNVITDAMPPSSIASHNAFFTRNNILRTSAVRGAAALAHCNIKVLILNRYGSRFLEGADALRDAIALYGRSLTAHARQISVQAEEAFFSNSSFHEQVSIVQEASIIVAAHGDSLANVIFSRPDTHIFELLPFGIRHSPYAALSRAFGAIHNRITSQPDPEVYTACIRHFNPEVTMERGSFLRHWRHQAQRFKMDTVSQGANALSDYSAVESLPRRTEEDGFEGDREGGSGVKSVEECAQYQRLSVDVRALARRVVRMAARQCSIHSTLPFLQ